jgi:hypothetical protein
MDNRLLNVTETESKNTVTASEGFEASYNDSPNKEKGFSRSTSTCQHDVLSGTSEEFIRALLLGC